eukprot:COSAG01_NODE_37625_length_501_cov_0.509950_2_plen_34_part_01
MTCNPMVVTQPSDIIWMHPHRCFITFTLHRLVIA